MSRAARHCRLWTADNCVVRAKLPGHTVLRDIRPLLVVYQSAGQGRLIFGHRTRQTQRHGWRLYASGRWVASTRGRREITTCLGLCVGLSVRPSVRLSARPAACLLTKQTKFQFFAVTGLVFQTCDVIMHVAWPASLPLPFSSTFVARTRGTRATL